MVTINLCKLFFIQITISLTILGFLINVCERYLPVFFTKTFRYGKFAIKQESKFVLEVPKSYFRHFYITSALIYYPIALYQVLSVYVMKNDVSDWSTLLLDFSCGFDRTATVSATRVLIGVILLVLQTSRRFYDTNFVSVFSTKATINLSHYLIGMAYYPAVMLIILSEAPKFAQVGPSNVSNSIQFKEVGLTEIIAIVMFLWAWYHQHVATVILANLRKNDKGSVISEKYEIPEGDWFKYVSSPHSTAEIVMYTALSLLLWNNTSWWCVYMWILSNQIETILLSHWWYQSKFKDFPKERKALIPYIY